MYSVHGLDIVIKMNLMNEPSEVIFEEKKSLEKPNTETADSDSDRFSLAAICNILYPQKCSANENSTK